jgi:hypothetical protein
MVLPPNVRTLSCWSLYSLALLAQEPSPMRDAVAIRGAAGLTGAEALASAQEQVAAHLRAAWRERAGRIAGEAAPAWLPQPCVDAVVARWLARLPADRLARVVDRDDRVREHGFGNSHQTTLWIAEEPAHVRAGEASLRSALAAARRDALARGGVVAVGWSAVGLGAAWFDRLTRGYMSGGLRLAAAALAAAVLAAALLV